MSDKIFYFARSSKSLRWDFVHAFHAEILRKKGFEVKIIDLGALRPAVPKNTLNVLRKAAQLFSVQFDEAEGDQEMQIVHNVERVLIGSIQTIEAIRRQESTMKVVTVGSLDYRVPEPVAAELRRALVWSGSQEIEDLKKELEETRKSVRSYENALKEANESKAQIEQARDGFQRALDRSISQSSNTISALKNSVETHQCENSSLRRKLANVENERASYKLARDRSVEQHSNTLKALGASNGDLIQTREKLKLVEQERDALKKIVYQFQNAHGPFEHRVEHHVGELKEVDVKTFGVMPKVLVAPEETALIIKDQAEQIERLKTQLKNATWDGKKTSPTYVWRPDGPVAVEVEIGKSGAFTNAIHRLSEPLVRTEHGFAVRAVAQALEKAKREAAEAGEKLKQARCDIKTLCEGGDALTRELDQLLNGPDAAPQASLSDLIAQIKALKVVRPSGANEGDMIHAFCAISRNLPGIFPRTIARHVFTGPLTELLKKHDDRIAATVLRNTVAMKMEEDKAKSVARSVEPFSVGVQAIHGNGLCLNFHPAARREAEQFVEFVNQLIKFDSVIKSSDDPVKARNQLRGKEALKFIRGILHIWPTKNEYFRMSQWHRDEIVKILERK